MGEYQALTDILAAKLRPKFDSMKKSELVDLLVQVIEAHPEAGQEILEREEAKTKRIELKGK